MLAYSSIENMGILVIGCALGGVGMFAAVVHLVGHSLIKASFFLTSGNILEIYGTKKIKKINGLLSVDKKTGWLWVLSMIGITAFPPSVLFISEFLMVQNLTFPHFIPFLPTGFCQEIRGKILKKFLALQDKNDFSTFCTETIIKTTEYYYLSISLACARDKARYNKKECCYENRIQPPGNLQCRSTFDVRCVR